MTKRNQNGGGDDLFRTLYQRHYGRMLRFFKTVFRLSEEDAQELTQDSFVRFYGMLDEYRGDAEWALLEKIARNVGYNRVRSLTTIRRGAVRTESLDAAEAAGNVPSTRDPDPVDRLIGEERSSRLRQAIAELPKGQRKCLELWLEDFSYEQISGTLHISIDAVRSRIRDARRLLRDRLGDETGLPKE